MSLLNGAVLDDDPEAIKRRILWLSELALVVDHISKPIEHAIR